jgi:hypothetical protein
MNQRGPLRTFLHDLRPTSRAVRDEHERTRRKELDVRAAAVLAVASDQTLHEVLVLHRPEVETSGGCPVCRGCDSFDGPDAEPPEWPCRTWSLVQRQLTR